MTETESLPAVSAFEANLVRLTRGLLGAHPRDATLKIVFRSYVRPKCLSAAAVRLVEDTLRKGVVARLARLGWPRDRFLRGGRPTTGRLWERAPLEERELEFSGRSLEWLIWLTANDPTRPAAKLKFQSSRGWTLGDELLQSLAFDLLGDSPVASSLARLTGFRTNALVQLAWPDAFAKTQTEVEIDFTPWLRPERTWVLETLQPAFAARFGNLETSKQELTDAGRLRAVGERQSRALSAYLDALEAAGRWDLAFCLFDGVRELMEGTARTLPWFGRLDVSALRMADRAETYRAGLACLHAFRRLVQWNERARNVGYVDEEYELAQLWKADWERNEGDVVVGHVEDVLRRHDLLDVR